MNLADQIKETYSDNFVAYYRAHSCHLNIVGTNFYEYHKLLQKVYEDAQENIDTIGEIIRTLDELAPETLGEILSLASLGDDTTSDTGAPGLLELVLDSQEHMIGSYRALYEAAEDADECDISNFSQDRIRVHKKFVWMLKSSLES